MKRRSLIIPFVTTLFLCSCSTTSVPPVVIHEDDFEFSIDYSNNESLKNELSQIYLRSSDIDRNTLDRFLGAITLNDLYADHVLIKEEKISNYYDLHNNPKAGNYHFIKTLDINRDNEKHSLSGAATIVDEKWVESEVEGNPAIHTKTSVNGKYSLVPNFETEVGQESLVFDDEKYSESNSIGVSQNLWANKMNLTQSNTFSELVKTTIENIDNQNETLASSYQYKTSITSEIVSGFTEVNIISSSNQPVNNSDNQIVITYKMNILVSPTMVTNMKYQHTIIEKDGEDDYLLYSDYLERNISKE